MTKNKIESRNQSGGITAQNVTHNVAVGSRDSEITQSGSGSPKPGIADALQALRDEGKLRIPREGYVVKSGRGRWS